MDDLLQIPEDMMPSIVSDYIKGSISGVLDDLLDDVAAGRAKFHTNGMRIAIFSARKLDGEMHYGWHYAPEDTLAGDRFHYDHGVGIDKNEDGQYLWVAPLLHVDLLDMIAEFTTYYKGPISGLFTFADGTRAMATLSMSMGRDYVSEVECALNGVTLTMDGLKEITSISPIPSEQLDIWKPSSVQPKDGDKVLSWDNDELRSTYEGPYWNTGEFKEACDGNRRYPGYTGPMISSLPWTSMKSWASLDDLFDLTMGEKVSDYLGEGEVLVLGF